MKDPLGRWTYRACFPKRSCGSEESEESVDKYQNSSCCVVDRKGAAASWSVMCKGTAFVEGHQGVKIAVHDLGGTGAPLLILQANGFHGRCYQPLADLLADRFHCYGVDMPGQGDSEHADGNTIEHFAADVLNIVDTLKLEGCYALGHSSGGTTAMLAEQKRPGTFRALYCYEPVIYDPREPLGNAPLTTDRAAGCLAKLALKRRRRFLSQDAALQSFLARPPFTCFHPSAVHMYVEHGTRLLPDGSWELKCQPETEAQVYLDVAEVGQRIFERLANTRCPTVIAAGCDASKHTFSYLAQEAVRTASILPNGRLERFEGTNHFGPMHDPARLAQRIRINFQAAEEEARWNSLPKSVLLAQSKM